MKPRRTIGGFTLIELLATLAVLAILGAILLPALARSRESARGAQCLHNIRQLQLAWVVYVDSHDDFLPPNNDTPRAGKDAEHPSWVAGWLRAEHERGSKGDSVNVNLLVGSQLKEYGSLGEFIQDVDVYRCPSDRSTVVLNGERRRRVRTLSMNCYLNGSGIWQSPSFVTYRRMADILDPSRTWVFIDEREDSVNDGYFAVEMEKRYALVDVPGSYHHGAANLSFADGHAEPHRWVEPTTNPPMVRGKHWAGEPVLTTPEDRDLSWLTERTTIRKTE